MDIKYFHNKRANENERAMRQKQDKTDSQKRNNVVDA